MEIAQIARGSFGNLGVTALSGTPSRERAAAAGRNTAVNFTFHAGSDSIRLLDPTRGMEWDETASSHPHFSVFHSSAWARVLIGTYGHKPFYLQCSENGRTKALLPLMEVASPLTGRRGVSLPFSDFSGALTFDHTSDRSLADRLRELGGERGWKHVEVRGGDPLTAAELKPS